MPDDVQQGGSQSAFGSGSTQEQTGGTDFVSSLPEEFRSHESFKGFKGLGDLAKDYLGLKSTVDKKFSELSPEDQDKYYAGKGRPTDVNGYEIKAEGVSDKLVGYFKEQAFKLGLSKKGAEEFAGNYISLSRQVAEEDAKAVQAVQAKEAETKLSEIKAKYGTGFETSMSQAANAIKQLGGSDLLAAIADSGLGVNAAFVDMMVKVGGLVKEGSLPDAGKPSGSAQVVQDEMAKLYSDPSFMKAYTTPGTPGHRENQERMLRLHQSLAAFKE